MKLFTVGKIGIFCDGIAHRLEKRKGDSIKVVDLTLRVQPFTAQLASALDQTQYGFVRRLLFKLQDASPNGELKSVEFQSPGDRQKLFCYASPDTETASICLDQVKVGKLRARTQKDINGWALYLYASFGPLGKTELEYVNAFYTEQRFISFEEAEPSLEFEEDEDDADGPVAEEVIDGRVVRRPMWDDDEAPASAAAETASDASTPAPEPARHASPRHSDRKSAAKAKQRAGKKR